MAEPVGEHAPANEPAEASSPYAVIVRAHFANEKVQDLLQILSQSKKYDLFVAVDETHGPLNFPGYRTLPHSTASTRAFELFENHHNILWQCGDYAFFFSAAQIPGYRYYIMIEYDVDIVRKSPEFVECLVSKLSEPGAPDFIAPDFYVASPEWCWTPAAAKQFPIVYNTGIFAFVAISAAALKHLYQRRKREARVTISADDIVMCEAFCGSALAQDGFSCASINQLQEGAVKFSSFHPPVLSLETSHYLLNRYHIPDPNIEIVHPVYGLSQYLQKQFEKFRHLNKIDRFLSELDDLDPVRSAEADLISSYRERSMELQEQHHGRG